MNQDGAYGPATVPEFSSFGGIFPSHFTGNQVTAASTFGSTKGIACFCATRMTATTASITADKEISLRMEPEPELGGPEHCLADNRAPPESDQRLRFSYCIGTPQPSAHSSRVSGRLRRPRHAEISVLGTDFVIGNYVLVPKGATSAVSSVRADDLAARPAPEPIWIRVAV